MDRIKLVSDDEIRARWGRAKYYEAYIPNDIESKVGVYFVVDSDTDTKYHLKKSEFDKYFIDVDQMRDDKIEQILK